MISIASDSFGSQILMKRGDDLGAIYFWDHVLENEEDDNQYSNVYLLADSFSRPVVACGIGVAYIENEHQQMVARSHTRQLEVKLM